MGKAEGDLYTTLAVSGMPAVRPLRKNVPGRHAHAALWSMQRGTDVEHYPDLMALRASVTTCPCAGAWSSWWCPRKRGGRLAQGRCGAGDDVDLPARTGPVREKQIARLRNFADQAVIAMENARLIDEQREALEQQTATADVLQVINASPGDLVPVFNSILEKSMRLCEAAFGTLYTYDGEHLHPEATQGLPAVLVDYHGRNPTQQPPLLALQVIEAKRPILVLDLREGEGYRSGHPGTRAVVELGGARTVLLVPLLKEQMVAGFVQLYRQEVRAFTDKQIALLENFAAQAVIAMESARLLNELRARTEELAQRQAELHVTFENMGDGVAMFDQTQHLVAWNRKFQDLLDVPDDIIAQRRSLPNMSAIWPNVANSARTPMWTNRSVAFCKPPARCGYSSGCARTAT